MATKRIKNLSHYLTAAGVTDRDEVRFALDNTQGATDRTDQMRLSELSRAMGRLNVLDFGAVGDGSTNDTAAIQSACDAAAAVGTYGRPQVYLPGNTYKTVDTIDVQDRIEIVGDGVDSTRILFEPAAGSKACLQFSDPSPYHWYGGARDLTIRMGTNAYNDLSGIYVQTGAFVRFENIHINFDGATAKDWYGFRIRGREHIEVTNAKILSPIGIFFEAESGGVGLDNSSFRNIIYLSSSTGTGETLTKPFAAVYVADDCYLQNVVFDGHHSVARKDHAIYWRYAGSAAATWSYDVAFTGWRTENMTDLIASTRIGGNKFEVDLNGAALRTNLSFENCQWHGPQHGLYMQNCNWVRMANVRFQSANKIAIKTAGANSFWCDPACSYRDTATAELASWWQTYPAFPLTSLHDSREWILPFPVNADFYFILPHIKRYNTANSVAKTITSLQADDYAEGTGFNTGHEIQLILDANTTLNHGTGTDQCELSGAVHWTPGAEATIGLRYDGDHWKEVYRST